VNCLPGRVARAGTAADIRREDLASMDARFVAGPWHAYVPRPGGERVFFSLDLKPKHKKTLGNPLLKGKGYQMYDGEHWGTMVEGEVGRDRLQLDLKFVGREGDVERWEANLVADDAFKVTSEREGVVSSQSFALRRGDGEGGDDPDQTDADNDFVRQRGMPRVPLADQIACCTQRWQWELPDAGAVSLQSLHSLQTTTEPEEEISEGGMSSSEEEEEEEEEQEKEDMPGGDTLVVPVPPVEGISPLAAPHVSSSCVVVSAACQ
jgi:hypothetical protein